MDTEVCKFYKIVNEKGMVSISEAAKLLEVAEDVVEEWARTLDGAELVSLDYPLNPLESPVVKKKGFKETRIRVKAQKKKASEKKKKGKKEEPLTGHVWRK